MSRALGRAERPVRAERRHHVHPVDLPGRAAWRAARRSRRPANAAASGPAARAGRSAPRPGRSPRATPRTNDASSSEVTVASGPPIPMRPVQLHACRIRGGWRRTRCSDARRHLRSRGPRRGRDRGERRHRELACPRPRGRGRSRRPAGPTERATRSARPRGGEDRLRSLACPVDILDPAQLAEARDTIVERMGGVDILVNVAGGNVPGATLDEAASPFELDLDAIRAVVDLNLIGALDDDRRVRADPRRLDVGGQVDPQRVVDGGHARADPRRRLRSRQGRT